MIIEMFRCTLVTFIFLAFVSGIALGQGGAVINVTLRGTIRDYTNNAPLQAATVTAGEAPTQTNLAGKFTLKINKGQIHLRCVYVGYQTIDTLLSITGDARIDLFLKGDKTSLKEVTVKGTTDPHKEIATQNVSVLEGSALEQTRGLSLGDALKSVTGVTTFQTGPSIAKPVIHGLTGARVLILNNGVALQAQQWGQEHAPEIDPFIANQIEVIKGAAGIRYGADAISGVVSVNPKPLPTDTGVMDGEANLVGMTNSRLGAVSAMLEGSSGKNLPGFSYRIQGTYKTAGNSSTPGYILGNTGLREGDYSAALQYHHKNYGIEAYYSDFDTKLGIEYDTEVGSITDLQLKIATGHPVTAYPFSYFIDRPYQLVNHATAKIRGFWNFSDNSKLSLQYAYQVNTRQEYEELSFSPSLAPALYLQIHTSTVDLNWDHKDGHGFSGSFGFSGMNQGNIRMYEYLIPNYVDYDGGLYGIEKLSIGKWLFEGGVRYDYRWLQAYAIDATVAKVNTTTTSYSGLSGTAGASYHLTEDLKFTANYSAAFRPPSINELYIDGVHQSVGEFEMGDPNLKTERANDFSLGLNYSNRWIALDLNGYYNRINNFIFEEPTGNYYHAPSGALLQFAYTQANVYFRGIDFGMTIKPTEKLEITSKSSLIYAWNETINNYLIYTPPMRLQNGASYHFGNAGPLRDFVIGAEDIYVAKQNDVPAGYDFAPPPNAYNLIDAHVGFKIKLGGSDADFDIAANNLTNVTYKDYLDRFRYFAAEPGRNIIFRLRVPFNIKKQQLNNN